MTSTEGRAFDSTGPTRPRRALLAVNPKSRNGSRDLGAAAAVLGGFGIDLIRAQCEKGHDLSACILAHRDEVDCVIVGGGDGTINAAGRGLIESGLPLGVLPLGTANDFARSLSIPSDIEAASRVIAEGICHQVDVGDVNGHVFFNVASVGLAADLAKSLTSERKRRFGRFSYAMSAARLLAKAAPFHATLLVGKGETREKVMVRTLQIAVGNGRYYGGGNVIAVDAQIDDGFLDLYSLEFSQIWRMALMLRTFPSGAHGHMPEVRTARGDSFEVITRKPRPVNADGELVTQTPAVFTQKKLAVSVYVPVTCPLATAPSSR